MTTITTTTTTDDATNDNNNNNHPTHQQEEPSAPRTTQQQQSVAPTKKRRVKRNHWQSHKDKKRRRKKESSLQEDDVTKNNNNNNQAVIVSRDKDNDDEIYYEIERIVDYRKRGKIHEFCVKWKNYEETTWEPEENLCDSALQEANDVRNRHEEEKLQQKLLSVEEEEEEEEEHEATPPPETIEDDINMMMENTTTPSTTPMTPTNNAAAFDSHDTTDCTITDRKSNKHKDDGTALSADEELEKEDDLFDWSDAGQVQFQSIVRIHVNEPDAGMKVTQNRLAGVPVVITGHTGWAQFAANWLLPITTTTTDPHDDHHHLPGPSTPQKQHGPVCIHTTQQQQQEKQHDNDDNDAHDTATTEEASDLEQEFDRIIKEINPNSPHQKKPEIENESNKEEETDDDNEPTTKLLDLSKPHKINIPAMIADIGEELVPVLRKKYDETNPIKGHVRVRKFLENPICWPQEHDKPEEVAGAATTTTTAPAATTTTTTTTTTTNPVDSTTMPLGTKKSGAALYLHQWQFPTSETAVPKLCGQGKNEPLPNGILGIDLLKYWLDEQQCAGDSVYQYLFMGNAGTMSKLHRDAGGLVITIAPIVGEKEVVLAHRADGATALYHLDADLEKINLHRFPLLYSARLWKTTLVPGEILIMPEATYHQCRNVTPCLSYSRFYLDTVNLKAFFESWRDQDAPEIDHLEILWNASSELSKKVDNFVEQFRKHDHVKNAEVPGTILSAVECLRTLRNIAREITLRCQQTEDPIAVEWNDMVGDIDDSLHRFRFRLRRREPPFRRRQLRKSPSKKKNRKALEKVTEDSADAADSNVTVPGNSFYSAHKKLPKLPPEDVGKMISDNIPLSVGDTIAVQILGKRIEGKIVTIQDSMRAAFVDYDEFLECDSEFLPLDCLRIPVVGGESSAEIDFRSLQPNMPVYKLDDGEEYRAVIKYWRQATFYLTELSAPDCKKTFKRWITREYIMERIGSPHPDTSVYQKANKTTILSETSVNTNASFDPLMPPSKAAAPDNAEALQPSSKAAAPHIPEVESVVALQNE